MNAPHWYVKPGALRMFWTVMGPLFLIIGVHSLVDNPDRLGIFIGIVQVLIAAFTLGMVGSVATARRQDGRSARPVGHFRRLQA